MPGVIYGDSFGQLGQAIQADQAQRDASFQNALHDMLAQKAQNLAVQKFNADLAQQGFQNKLSLQDLIVKKAQADREYQYNNAMLQNEVNRTANDVNRTAIEDKHATTQETKVDQDEAFKKNQAAFSQFHEDAQNGVFDPVSARSAGLRDDQITSLAAANASVQGTQAVEWQHANDTVQTLNQRNLINSFVPRAQSALKRLPGNWIGVGGQQPPPDVVAQSQSILAQAAKINPIADRLLADKYTAGLVQANADGSYSVAIPKPAFIRANAGPGNQPGSFQVAQPPVNTGQPQTPMPRSMMIPQYSDTTNTNVNGVPAMSATSNGPSSAGNPYKVGARYGNLRYAGGDPSSEDSWQPAQQ